MKTITKFLRTIKEKSEKNVDNTLRTHIIAKQIDHGVAPNIAQLVDIWLSHNDHEEKERRKKLSISQKKREKEGKKPEKDIDITSYIDIYMKDDKDIENIFKPVQSDKIVIFDGEPVPKEVYDKGEQIARAWLTRTRKKRKMKKVAS